MTVIPISPLYPRHMDDLSREHLEWLEAQNDRAPNTIASRRRVLRSVGNAGTATRDELDEWWQSRAHLKDGTRVVDLSHLREFYHWCAVYERRMDNPSVRLRAPRVEAPDHEESKVSDQQITDFADAIPPDLARAVYLGAGAGLRVAESAVLDWADINTSTDMIRVVRSKGKKTRHVPVSPQLIQMLGAGTSRTGNVVTAGGAPYSPAQLQRRLNRALRAAGAEFTSHDLRHRFGITAYRSLPDLLAVGEMMGHSSTNTTKRYASASTEAKRRIAAAVMWQ